MPTRDLVCSNPIDTFLLLCTIVLGVKIAIPLPAAVTLPHLAFLVVPKLLPILPANCLLLQPAAAS